jgi:hypothetical protein
MDWESSGLEAHSHMRERMMIFRLGRVVIVVIIVAKAIAQCTQRSTQIIENLKCHIAGEIRKNGACFSL